jgi:hypothetical protein
MGRMTNPKPFIIIILTCQEMMAWMSMELIGFRMWPGRILAEKLGKSHQPIFVTS